MECNMTSDFHSYIINIQCWFHNISLQNCFIRISPSNIGIKHTFPHLWECIKFKDHVHITERPAPSTRSSVTLQMSFHIRGLRLFQMHGLSDSMSHWQLIFWVQVRLRIEVGLLRTPSSIRLGFEFITSGL